MIHDDLERIAAYRAAGWWGDDTIDDLIRRAVAARPDETALVDTANRADFGMGPAHASPGASWTSSSIATPPACLAWAAGDGR